MELGALLIIVAVLSGIFAAALRRRQVAGSQHNQARALMDQELRASTELFQGVLDGASETSIIAADEFGTVTVFNRGAELLLGYGASEVCGRLTLADFHDAAEIAIRAVELGAAPGVEVLIGSARRGGPESREWTYLSKSGSRIPVSLTVTAMETDGELRGFIAVARDLTAQRRAERRIEFGNEAFRSAFDSAPVAVLLTKPDMTCAHASPAFCRLTGFTRRQLATMSMLDLIVPDDEITDPDQIFDQEHAKFEGVLSGRAAQHHSERRVRCADGTTVAVREHTSLVTDEEGAPLLFVTHLEDITQELRVQGALREALARNANALEKLEEIDRAKNDFVSMVSHELRSPVTSIIGYLELLADGCYGELGAPQGEALGIVGRNAARLEQLIADLLTVSRLETESHAVLEKAPVDVGALVEGVTISMLPITNARGQQLTLNIDEAFAVVLGDERQLEHVVTNLLTNASKFTPEGGEIMVDVGQADDVVVIAVRDSGIGIPPEDLSKVFSRFYRGSGPLVAQVPGTGLGLSIVHGIVRQHGGEVAIESEVGVGTTVKVALPPGLPSPLHAMASD